LNKSLLDTDILSDITKAVNLTVAGHATAYRQAFSRYTISTITFMEVIRGYQKKQATRRLQNFLTAMTSEEIIPFDKATAELAGRIAGELERKNQPAAARRGRTHAGGSRCPRRGLDKNHAGQTAT
jgi:tRNA(fMet)-specific endonuclease VapC